MAVGVGVEVALGVVRGVAVSVAVGVGVGEGVGVVVGRSVGVVVGVAVRVGVGVSEVVVRSIRVAVGVAVGLSCLAQPIKKNIKAMIISKLYGLYVDALPRNSSIRTLRSFMTSGGLRVAPKVPEGRLRHGSQKSPLFIYNTSPDKAALVCLAFYNKIPYKKAEGSRRLAPQPLRTLSSGIHFTKLGFEFHQPIVE